MGEIRLNTVLEDLILNIEETVKRAKENLAGVVNSTMTETYWLIGKYIVESEQNGSIKAAYGSKLLTTLSKELTLRLGKGYSRPNLNNMRKFYLRYPDYHLVSLVFYHRILKCFVLIDLKKNSVRHEDIGQMNMYLGYFAMEENMPDDNAPIGIILSKNKDELLVEYATYGIDSNLFVSKYELYLPNRKELEKLVYNILHDDIQNE